MHESAVTVVCVGHPLLTADNKSAVNSGRQRCSCVAGLLTVSIIFATLLNCLIDFALNCMYEAIKMLIYVFNHARGSRGVRFSAAFVCLCVCLFLHTRYLKRSSATAGGPRNALC